MKRNKSLHAKSFAILGKNIRTKRLQKRLSQEELAFRISSTRNYIGCIERGEKAPSISIVLDIAKELGCQINELFINI